MIVSIMATDEPNGPVFWIWFLISLYPTICQQVRRLHDADHSGVWVILEAMLYIVSPFVPETWPLSLIVGLVVFVFLLRPGDEGANRYGVRS